MSNSRNTLSQMMMIIAVGIVLFVGAKIINPVSKSADLYDRIPMIMVADGKLYLDTGYKSAQEVRPDSVIYTINSAVDGSETPIERNQSNFGIGCRYQFVSDETIEVELDRVWWIYATESRRQGPDFWKYLRRNDFSPLSSTKSNPVAAVQVTIEDLAQKAYTRSVRLDKATLDKNETLCMIEMYKGSSFAERRGWTDEYLDEFFIAVRAEYCIEYDHDKTFLDDGNIDQYFYLIKDPETDVWMIVDASTNSQPGSNP